MMNPKLPTAIAALFFCASCIARGELAFEKTQIELHPKSTDPEAVANFKYENKGKAPIRIKSVRTSCGCTVASLKKDVVEPGEKGEVTATFHVAGRTGTQEKAITVETDDASQPVMTLTLKAVIEQPIELQPTFVYWQANEAPKPKVIDLKTAKDVKLTKVDLTASNEDFTTKVEKVSATEYKISVEPKDTAQIRNTTFTIKTDLPQPYYVTARVTPAAGTTR